MSFKIGDRVTWTSQAGGRSATKEGAVVEIVAPGQRPAAKLKDPGFPRDHESYLVRGYKTTDRKRVADYWPAVKALHPVYSVFNEQTLREEIVRVWGPAGAHVEVYDMLLQKAKLSNSAATICEEDRKTIDLLVRASVEPTLATAKKWEALVHEELRSAQAAGVPLAIQMAEWGVKIVTSIIAGREP